MANQHMNSFKKPMTLLVSAGILAGGILLILFSDSSESRNAAKTASEPDAPIVETVQAIPAKNTYTITTAGRLRAREQTALIGEVAGKIVWIADKFVVGGRFKKGENLFRIDQTDYITAVKSAKAGLGSAKATLTQAKKAYQRQNDLIQSGVISEQANDGAIANLVAANAGVLQAETQLEQAEANLSRTELKAPYDAQVIDENVALDTYVAPGQQLGRISDIRMGEFQAGLSPEDTKALAKALRSDSRVEAVLRPNTGSLSTATLSGWVHRFAPNIDSSSRTARIIALFPGAFSKENEGKVFNDDFMTIEINVSVPQTVWRLPVGTVRENSFVWSVEQGQIYSIAVSVLNETKDFTRVTSDISLEGLRLMRTLLNNEHNEKRVTVINHDATDPAEIAGLN